MNQSVVELLLSVTPWILGAVGGVLVYQLRRATRRLEELRASYIAASERNNRLIEQVNALRDLDTGLARRGPISVVHPVDALQAFMNIHNPGMTALPETQAMLDAWRRYCDEVVEAGDVALLRRFDGAVQQLQGPASLDPPIARVRKRNISV